MKRVLSLIMIIVLSFSVFLTGCSKETTEEATPDTATTEATPETTTDATEEATTTEKTTVKAGFIYVGPIGDGGWSYAHNEGRLYIEKELGIETLYKESVPESQEVESTIKDMIDQGCNVIFATSFGYMDYVEKVAKDYPDVKFLHCSGYKTSDNMSNYFGRIYQARYLSGIVAGLKTKSNKIGYVAAYTIPEVVRGINAFTLGVRSVNPEAKVYVSVTHTWYDPAKEKDSAIALLDQGADVIAQHQDTAGPQQAAEERGAFSIGYNTDMKDKAPKAYMTAPIWNWGIYYKNQIQEIQNGTWKSSSYWGGLNDNIVELAPLTENAPAEATEKVETAKTAIMDGSLDIFAGPIKDQTGAIKVSEGTSLTDAELLSFDWFVEGVEGTIEK